MFHKRDLSPLKNCKNVLFSATLYQSMGQYLSTFVRFCLTGQKQHKDHQGEDLLTQTDLYLIFLFSYYILFFANSPQYKNVIFANFVPAVPLKINWFNEM